jgi:hypothetical protein
MSDTMSKIKEKFVPKRMIINDGGKKYHFYQKVYYEDFLEKCSTSKAKTYEMIAQLASMNDSDGKDKCRTAERYHDILLFNGKINTNAMASKLVGMLLSLQWNADFNPLNHTYIDEYDDKIKEKSYKWDDRQAKWHDIVGFDDSKKNNYIAGYIISLIHLLADSELYTVNLTNETVDETGFYDDRIKEINYIIDELYLTDQEMNDKWKNVFKPVSDMIHMADYSGIYDPIWIEANEAITYFDPAFDIYDKDKSLFYKIKSGKLWVKFRIDPDDDMLKRQSIYIKKIHEEDNRTNAHRSENMLFEEELIKAFMTILKNEFRTS